MTSSLPLIMLGAGGHAKVLLALATALGSKVAGVCDPALAQSGLTHWRGVPVLGSDDALNQFSQDDVALINGIGQVIGSGVRAKVFARFRDRLFHFPPLLHPAAWVAATAELGDGVQIMAGAIVQPDSRVGPNTIINTRASIDHDCQIGADVHVAPGAILCGGVTLGDRVFIASGATVIQGISIGAGAIVGAGAVVVRDLEAGAVLLGTKPRLRPHA
ncbi:acetyltransferase [Janthinobacterium sp. PC23-8]|uniref:acetyltransferase n=1 Tax=Janthinobacterium sp. PC23-8 TaxID=2012679 RepID=UPI000B96F94F|nr:acetyltransferase [Janthinobacterium sp. PC23-8]OYO31200.1 acetyltransferase [Janthinobacterium sp. PC23-8]